jgi:4-diphosphocytidyl-2-C-methyl-D-erythritol kinase
VYRAYDAAPRVLEPRPAAPDGDFAAVVRWLEQQRNDLQGPAVALTPEIGAALEQVRRDPDVAFARMSGSGATVFGLCADAERAAAVAARLSEARPDWWVQACVLGGP